MSAAIQGIYIALFGRPADPGGLAYWTEVTKGGADLSAMLSVLPNLTEYTTRFEGQTPDQVITTVYQNLFGRAPDAEGLAFFKGQLASGAQTLATIAVNIMQGAQGDDKADVTAKVGAAELFTASLDTQAEIDAYKGADAAALAKKFLDTIDKDKPATPESVEKAAGAVVAGQDPTGGQAPNPGGGGTGGTPQPVDTVTTYSDATVTAVDPLKPNSLYVGSGISAGNFEVTKTSLSKVELALKGMTRGEGDVTNVGNVYKFDAINKAGFAFSVNSFGDKTIAELMSDGYSFHLKVDNDGGAGFGNNAVELTLGQLGLSSNPAKSQDSGYDWVTTGGAIVDDEGDGSISAGGHVTQNVQTPIWYGSGLNMGNEVLKAGEYSVSLEMRKGGTTVATETIVLDVAKYGVGVQYVGPVVGKDDGTYMFGSSSNPTKNFVITRIDTDQNGVSDIILGLGGQQQKGPAIYEASGNVIRVVDGTTPVVKWSVETSDGKPLASILAAYDVKLLVDTDGVPGGAVTEFTAIADANASGGVDWQFADSSANKRLLTDDAGTAFVSQNKQALSWLLPDIAGKLFSGTASSVAPGDYTVTLAVYEKGSANIVGSNTVVFDVTDFQ